MISTHISDNIMRGRTPVYIFPPVWSGGEDVLTDEDDSTCYITYTARKARVTMDVGTRQSIKEVRIAFRAARECGIDFFFIVSHGGMKDRRSTCEFRNARSPY